MREKVLIKEVGLRDGIQLLKNFCPTNIKLKWLEAQVKSGFKEIEVTSFVSKKVMFQFSDSEIILKTANEFSELTSYVLVPNFRGAEIALENNAKNINFVISASEEHNMANVNQNISDSLENLKEFISNLRNHKKRNKVRIAVTIATCFGCSIKGEIRTSEVMEIVENLIQLKVDEIGIADTVGYANPNHVKELFKEINSINNFIPVTAHFHDTRGMGMMNILCSLDQGIRRFDTSIQGLGGCPFAPGASGNVVTEDCVFFLEEIGFDTGINLKKIFDLSLKIKEWLPNEIFYGKISVSGFPKKKPYKNL